ncbi:MAG: tRNA pseudouridine(65) synthase TruC [Proteobacteria bacterium]|nr:MAG: tRNA pseudouridine(65) synthase TruC [Pseudomonadota bacterium]
MSQFRILYEDEWVVAVDKPSGFFTHPPEDDSHARIPKSVNGLALLRDQLGLYVYPAHRLDRATSGVLLYAKSPEAAGAFGKLFQNHQVEKTYFAFARGWMNEPITVDRPLDGKESVTEFRPAFRASLPVAVGARYSELRLTLIEAKPLSGRFHQIRRHLQGLTHPILGDSLRGDGQSNRAFREVFPGHPMMLKCYRLAFPHPFLDQKRIVLRSRWGHEWHSVFEQIGFCGWGECQ